MEGQEKRWTARRKTDIELQILRQTTTVVDIARANDLTSGEVRAWPLCANIDVAQQEGQLYEIQ